VAARLVTEAAGTEGTPPWRAAGGVIRTIGRSHRMLQFRSGDGSTKGLLMEREPVFGAGARPVRSGVGTFSTKRWATLGRKSTEAGSRGAFLRAG